MKLKFAALAVIALVMALGCKHEILQDPGTGTTSTEICFESEVLPIFQSNCAKAGCHDALSHREGRVLNSYDNIMRNGIVPGNALASGLYKLLYASGENKMPPNGNPGLTDAQKATIGIWINQGAKNTTNCGTACDENAFAYTANVKPIMSNYCTGCHSGANASKGIDLSTAAGVKSAGTSGRLMGAISHISGYVAMPQGGAQLSDCQIAVIQKWLAAGAPNN
jgi:uncharacterized membrane protein